MADIIIPPWLHPQADPVATFLHAFQTGAQISEEQTRLAEQQRQANMEAQARSEQLQSNMLRAMTETAVQKEYQQQQIGLRQQELAQEKQRYDALGQQAAASLAARIQNEQALRDLRERDIALKEKVAAQGKVHFGTGGEVTRELPDGTLQVIRPPRAEGVKETFKETSDEGDISVTGTPEAVAEYRKRKAAEKAAEEAKRGPGIISRMLGGLNLGDVLKYQLTGQIPPLSNLAPPQAPGPKTQAQSPYPEGTILRKKDGSRWIVRNGEAVPYAD